MQRKQDGLLSLRALVKMATSSHFVPMKPREILDISETPDGKRLELSKEGGHFVIRVAGATLMTSAAHGSERALATWAAESLGKRRSARVLVGGLGMGFTLQAALSAFGSGARITVAELLPQIITYNRGELGEVAGRPLEDPQVRLFEGDVRVPLTEGGWDAVLLDVDNGPDPFTSSANASLYDNKGVAMLRRALTPAGVLAVWSAYPSPPFEKRLARVGLHCETKRVFARGEVRKGSKHTLFLARAKL